MVEVLYGKELFTSRCPEIKLRAGVPYPSRAPLQWPNFLPWISVSSLFHQIPITPWAGDELLVHGPLGNISDPRYCRPASRSVVLTLPWVSRVWSNLYHYKLRNFILISVQIILSLDSGNLFMVAPDKTVVVLQRVPSFSVGWIF